MEAIAHTPDEPFIVWFTHRLIATLRSGYRVIILAFLICMGAEVLGGFLNRLENSYYYLPNVTTAPSSGFIPAAYALPLLYILHRTIPVAVFLIFYARSIYPKQGSEWAISIIATFAGAVTGSVIGLDISIMSNVSVVQFFYLWYAILIFSDNWFNIAMIGLGGMLAANLRHIRHTRG